MNVSPVRMSNPAFNSQQQAVYSSQWYKQLPQQVKDEIDGLCYPSDYNFLREEPKIDPNARPYYPPVYVDPNSYYQQHRDGMMVME